jgi:hypothetical protein
MFAGRKLEGEKGCSSGGRMGRERRWLGFSGGCLGGWKKEQRLHAVLVLLFLQEETTKAGRRKGHRGKERN